MPLHNDEPTLVDLLQRTARAQSIATEVSQAHPPAVFGIHGTWGSGKTTFLHLLHAALTGETLFEDEDCRRRAKEIHQETGIKNTAVVWFEAWRYQSDPNPIIPLLQEITAQLPFKSRVLNKARKLSEVTIRGALMSLEELTKKVGLRPSVIAKEGEQWERAHYSAPVPSNTIRKLLEKAIAQFIGDNKKSKPRLVVIIDDLDRCQGPVAFRLLEGIKIYLNLPNCVFILGMNQRVIQDGLEKEFGVDSADDKAKEFSSKDRAKEYLEKLCQHIWHLPLSEDPSSDFCQWLKEGNGTHVNEVCQIAKEFNVLPRNARKVKSFASSIQQFLELLHVEPLDETLQRRKTKIMLMMAYLYHFHPDIYQAIETEPNYYNEVLYPWASAPLSDSGIVPHDTLRHLKPQASEDKDVYPHYDRTNVLRVQKLILDDDMQNIEIDLLSQFILH